MPAFKIKKVVGREILDSRGNPTVEADVYVGNVLGRAAVPSGASTGIYEALELRDGGSRFGGLGVSKAVENIFRIGRKIEGIDCSEQRELDKFMIEMDGTENKSVLGANAILAVSLATARAAALASGMPLYQYLTGITGSKKHILPIPFCNVINGGKHAGGKLAMQEFMIAPLKAGTFREAMQMASETYHALKNVIVKKYGKPAANVGDEGGFAPPIATPEEALELLSSAVDQAGYAKKIKFAMDVAASEFFQNGAYVVNDKKYSGTELLDYYKALISKYPIISIEDPFNQDDFESYSRLTKSAIQVVGDDLLVTNTKRIQMALAKKACNCLLLKLNQIGTLTEAIEAAQFSMQHGWKVMVSHRSGETEDAFIADLSVALACGEIKSGAPCRAERTAKYNQLLRIEEELGKKAAYARIF
jgi:enolase